ncbi:MAG: TIGR02584 family CRISPR-associated protein, partial [Betaproteobacteria bacterium]|nr:TIGR02584 family CRISPR-associated protein [Betaproteobacteria bacterium]
PEFFYPPRQPRRLATRDGRHIDTADAKVTLAEIPFVRLRHGLPEALLQGEARFSEAVSAIQQSFAPPFLRVDLKRREVFCGDARVIMKPQLLAWLAWWATLARQGRPEAAWRDADAGMFLDIYRSVVGVDAVKYEKEAELLGGGMDEKFFQTMNAKLGRVLKNALGPAAAPYLLITTGKRPHTRRGLTLLPDSIRIIDGGG